MDWNNDGRVNAHDFAHYKSLIDTGSSSSGSSSYSSSNGSTGAKWFVILILVIFILKLNGT
jgi:hypothetical protein